MGKKLLISIIIIFSFYSINIQANADVNNIRNEENTLDLTEEELDFLENHPVMRISNEMNWMPFDYVENGQPSGISIEYMELIADIIGVEFEFVNGYT